LSIQAFNLVSIGCSPSSFSVTFGSETGVLTFGAAEDLVVGLGAGFPVLWAFKTPEDRNRAKLRVKI